MISDYIDPDKCSDDAWWSAFFKAFWEEGCHSPVKHVSNKACELYHKHGVLTEMVMPFADYEPRRAALLLIEKRL